MITATLLPTDKSALCTTLDYLSAGNRVLRNKIVQSHFLSPNAFFAGCLFL